MKAIFNFAALQKAHWIFIKEVQSFMGSNLPPISVGIIMLWCGLASAMLGASPGVDMNKISMALYWVMYVGFILCFIFLSMSSFVSEKRQGTMELLYTLPISDAELVLGKFLFGMFGSAVLTVLLTGFYMIGIAGSPWYMVVSGSFGLFLVGLYVYSVGLFASSISNNYLLALLVSALIIISIEVGSFLSGLLPSPAKDILKHMHAFAQFKDFTIGVISLRSTVFFLSLTVFFLFSSVKVLESRRWRSQA